MSSRLGALASRVRVRSSAPTSRSSDITRPAPAANNAAVCPPRPTVQSTYTPSARGASIERTSDVSTGACPVSDAKLRERSGVVIAKRLALELGDEPLVIPYVHVIHLADDIDVAGHAGCLTQTRRNQHASLHVELADLTVVVDPVKKFQPRRVGAGHSGKPLFDRCPNRHWVDPNGISGYA